MKVVQTETLGLLVCWDSPSLVPAYVDVFSADAHVGRVKPIVIKDLSLLSDHWPEAAPRGAWDADLPHAILPIGDLVALYPAPLSVRDRQVHTSLANLEFPAPFPGGRAKVEFSGKNVKLWTSKPLSANDADVALLIVDGVLAGITALGPENHQTPAILELPGVLFDDRDHILEVRSGKAGNLLYSAPLSLKDPRTSFDVVEAALVNRRYASLQRTMERLSQERVVEAGDIRRISHAHGAVAELRRDQQRYDNLPPIPCSVAPLYSVVLAADQDEGSTRRSIASIIYTLHVLEYEVILVDQHGERFSDIDGLQVAVHPGTSLDDAWQAGAPLARGKYIIFLKAGVELFGGWMEELHLPFKIFADVGATSTTGIEHLQMLNGISPEPDTAAGEIWQLPDRGELLDPSKLVDCLSDTCWMIPADLLTARNSGTRQVSLRVDAAQTLSTDGLRIVSVPHAQVLDHGTTRRPASSSIDKMAEPHAIEDRWRGSARQSISGSQRKALILIGALNAIGSGAAASSFEEQLRALQILGFEVSIYAEDLEALALPLDLFERVGVEVLTPVDVPSIYTLLDDQRAWGLIYLVGFPLVAKLVALIRTAPRLQVLINCDDLHVLKRPQAGHPGSTNAVYEAELTTLRSECELVFAESNKDALAKLRLKREPRQLPMVLHPRVYPLKDRRGVGLFGNFHDPQTRQALERFHVQAWPHFRRKLPFLALRIGGVGLEHLAGLNLPAEFKLDGSKSAADIYGASRVALAIDEHRALCAMATGTPVLILAAPLHSAACDLSVVSTANQDWLAAVSRLFADEAGWRAASAAGSALIKEHHSFSSLRLALADALGIAAEYDAGVSDDLRLGAPLHPYRSIFDMMNGRRQSDLSIVG